MGGSAPAKKDGVYGVVEELSSGILVAVPLALFPEPQSSVCSHVTLVCPALSPPEPRVNVCDQYLCFGLLRGCSSGLLSLPGGQNPSDFHSWMLYW